MSRVTKAYLIGESAEVIATELRDRALFEISRTLEAALTRGRTRCAQLRQAQSDCAALTGVRLV